MQKHAVAIASVKSFGDFVIAHSVLHRIAPRGVSGIRLIAGSHLKHLNEILPDNVYVTVVDTGEDRVPAIFDVKKCGLLSAAKSAISLRRALQGVERRDAGEHIAFDVLGRRERFIAGLWPTISPRIRYSNIYETYAQFLIEHGVARVIPERPNERTHGRSVGIFPESRLVSKRLEVPTLNTILQRTARAGLDAKIFILEGDSLPAEYPGVVRIPRNFSSLAAALKSVDLVVSADSLPAHLAEYFARPVFVATPSPNEYWLPHECFKRRHWGLFERPPEFTVLLDGFLKEFGIGSTTPTRRDLPIAR